jgi:hypothetical protein
LYLLLFLQVSEKFDIPECIDKVVCTELSDLLWDLTGKLLALVTGNISYGPYGKNYIRAPYMVRKEAYSPLVYSKRFPKAFTDRTVINEDGYPEYYCRDNRQTFTVCKPGFLGQEVVRNNRWVILYNPYLL